MRHPGSAGTFHTGDNSGDAGSPPVRRPGWVALAGVVRGCGRLIGSWLLAVAVGLIGCYQRWISPGLAPRCRFYPSCSTYAVAALRSHGLARGGVLAARRLLRCHPWNPGGVDPVPLKRLASVHGQHALVATSPPNPPGA